MNLLIKPFRFFLMALLLMSCSSPAKSHIPRLNGKYVELRSKDFTMDLTQRADSVFGRHCFVSKGGTRIDCCDDTTTYSIRLKHDTSGSFIGVLKNCYDDASHDVKLVAEGKNVQLIFIGEPHPFARDTLTFTPSRN